MLRKIKRVIQHWLDEQREAIFFFRYLWVRTKVDCRMGLIEEFLFDPSALKQRYFEERKFEQSLAGRWR